MNGTSFPLTGDSNSETVANLIRDIARTLVDDPDAVAVTTIRDGEAIVLKLRVSPVDIGKVIGRQGRTARSLRTILGAASMKLKQRFSLDILQLEDIEGPSPPTPQ